MAHALPDVVLTLNSLRLRVLPPLPPNLTKLECYGNRLTALPDLPATLRILFCLGNQITALPALPPNLTDLNCRSNELTSLPALPPRLVRLACGSNQLTSLPALPPDLVELRCDFNQLTALPALPPNLTTLECYGNRLTALPALPPGLQNALFARNPITRVTLPFPQGIMHLRMDVIFEGSGLEYLPDETLQAYQARMDIEKARGVRNARLVGEYANLPHGVESLIASNLSGIEGKNAAQQGDILANRTGIDRKGYSGGRRRTRRAKKSRRLHSRRKRI